MWKGWENDVYSYYLDAPECVDVDSTKTWLEKGHAQFGHLDFKKLADILRAAQVNETIIEVCLSMQCRPCNLSKKGHHNPKTASPRAEKPFDVVACVFFY